MQSKSDSEINDLFEAYLPKLVRLAEHRIDERFKSKFDPDDVAATVLRSVYRRIKLGTFSFDDDSEFWRLLVTVTKRKISNKVRHFRTQSRSIECEISNVADLLKSVPEPTAEEATAFNESLDLLYQSLDEVQQKVFQLRMDGCEYHEIAHQIDMSERNVRRKMDVVKARACQIFFEDPVSPETSEGDELLG